MAPPINKPKPEPWYPPGFVPPKPKVAADPEAKAAHANAPTERAAPAMTLEQRNKAFMADVASRSAVVEANKPFGAAKPATSFADLREPSVIRESYLNKPEAAKPMVSIGPDAQSRARAEATAHAPSKSAGAQSHDGHKPERVADAGARKPHVHVHPPVQPRSAFGEQLHAEAKEITRANGVVRSALAQGLHPDAIKAVVENRLQGHAKDVAMKMLDGANDTGTMAERLADSQKVASVLQATAAKARDPEHAQELVSAKLKGDMASSAGTIVANLANHSHTKEQESQLNAERLASTLSGGSASGVASAAANQGMSSSMSHGASVTDSISVGVSAAVSESVKTAAQATFGETSSSSAGQSSSVTAGFSEGPQVSVGQSLASSAAMLSGHSVGATEGSSHSASTQTSNSDGFSASLGAVLAGSASMSHSAGHSESMTQSTQNSVSMERSAGNSEVVHMASGSGTSHSSTSFGMTQSSANSESMAANFVSEGMSSGSSRSASETQGGQTTESGNLLSEVRSNTEVYSDGSSVTQRSSTVSWTDAEGVHSNSRMETITQAAEHGGSGVGGAKGLAGLDMGGSSISTNAGMSSSSSESMSSNQGISRGDGAKTVEMMSSTHGAHTSSSTVSWTDAEGVHSHSRSETITQAAEHGGSGVGGAKGLAGPDMGGSSISTSAGMSSSESMSSGQSISRGEGLASTDMGGGSSSKSAGMSSSSSESMSSDQGVSRGDGAKTADMVSSTDMGSTSHKSTLGAMSSESVTASHSKSEGTSASISAGDSHKSTLGAMSSESVTASRSMSEGTSASISASDSHKSALGAMSSESVTASRSMSEGTSASISASDSHKSALGAMSSESVTASRSMSEGTSASISASDSHKSALGAMSSESVSVGRENGEAQSARMAMSDAEASREVKTFNIEASKSEGVAHAAAEGSSQARSSVPIEERSTFASAEPSRAVPVEERSTFAEPGQHLSPGQSFFQNAVSSVVNKLPDSVAEVAQNGLEKAQAVFTSASEKVADTIHAAASAGSRVSLEDALAAHMRDKGFDAESIAAAGAIADAIRSESPDVKAESVIVLHRAGANGEPLATVVHAKDAASAAMAGDSVLALDTLDKIASQGMDSKSVSQLRSGMPEAVAGQSDLELAQITGPAKTALGGELNQAQEQTRQQEQNAQREAKQAESAQGREMAMAMQ